MRSGGGKCNQLNIALYNLHLKIQYPLEIASLCVCVRKCVIQGE